MLVPADIIAAKLLGQITKIPTVEIRRTLQEADRAPDALMDLIARLAEKTLLRPAQIKQARRFVAMFEHVRYEAMFLNKLQKAKSVSSENMHGLMAKLEGSLHPRRLGPVLVDMGWLTPDQARKVEQQTRNRLLKEDLRVLERYREEKFKGIGKPLIKQAVIDDSIFRVSILFHSQETIDLVNAQIEKLKQQPYARAELTPYTIDPAAAKATIERRGSTSSKPIVHDIYLDDDPLGESMDDSEDEAFEEAAAQMHKSITTSRFNPKALQAALQEEDEDLDERTDIGPFEVMECLGQGGMGAVYMCRDSDNGSMAAVKVMLAKKAKAVDVQRFHREAHITGLLDHKNTIRLIDQGKTEDNLDWMAISLCAGKSLKGLLKREGRLLVDVAFHIFEQILEGLESVHQRGIVHRDLKPENIFVQAGNNQRVTIMDFGIARLMDSDKPKEQQAFRTNAGIVSGSPSYIAPETISGDDIDASTDIYSLGIMFYEMLTGKLPLIANTPYDYLREHLIGIPMTLNQGHSNNYWCRDLEQLLASMLAKEREDRPQSCQVILDAVNGGIRTKTLEQLKSPPKDAGGKSLFNNFFKLLGR
jgi:serine/threonine protein kinase